MIHGYFKEYFDYKTFIMTLVLSSIGLISIYSATYDAGATASFYRQLIWAGAGLVALIVTSIVPMRTLQRLAIPSYVTILVLLAFVLVAGKTISGAKSWFGFGGYGIQPSELAKVATVLAIAAFISRPDTSPFRARHIFSVIGLTLVPVAMVLAQPDLGTALVFLGMLVPLLYWWGVSKLVLLAIVLPVICGAAALFGTVHFLVAVVLSGAALFTMRENRFISAVAFATALVIGVSVQTVYERLPAYQQKRIATFLDSNVDKLGAGWNVEQSKVAIGSGGLLGKGYLRGTQTQLNFIPEQWTDFIFCVPGEEFGLAGGSLVIVIFGLLLWHGASIASACKSRFTSAGAIGIISIFAVHFFVNIGMAVGIMPVIGIPLPFMSYGGSALLANMIMSGLLMNFYANRKEH